MIARSVRSVISSSVRAAGAPQPRFGAVSFVRAKHSKSSHDHLVVGIQVLQRHETVPELQTVLSKYGGIIHARLGLRHDTHDHGLIILDIRDHRAERDDLLAELKAVGGVDVQAMRFKDPHE